MPLTLYHVDAFASGPFTGNPAAVIPLDDWLPDATLQAIAAEQNLSETAFLVPRDDPGHDFHLRWFTPAIEVELCGHATLATAHVLREHLAWTAPHVTFASRSGRLGVRFDDDRIVLDFPAHRVVPAPDAEAVAAALRATPTTVFSTAGATGDMRCRLAVFDDEARVRAVAPDFRAVAAIAGGCTIVTAPGSDVDFVSRFFAPGAGIDEDPVTGSAHCALAPYWAERLGKTRLHARQVSARTGELTCAVRDDRVHIGGRARTWLVGEIAADALVAP